MSMVNSHSGIRPVRLRPAPTDEAVDILQARDDESQHQSDYRDEQDPWLPSHPDEDQQKNGDERKTGEGPSVGGEQSACERPSQCPARISAA
jgi:hypothetical protein